MRTKDEGFWVFKRKAGDFLFGGEERGRKGVVWDRLASALEKKNEEGCDFQKEKADWVVFFG